MVAQTISYGLFSARATGEPVLGLAHLEAMVPNTNPFLKELFAEFVSMSGTEKHQIDFDELGVSELVEMLNEVNVEAVLQDFGKQTGGGTQDPVIYFYEDFLKDYDKDAEDKARRVLHPEARRLLHRPLRGPGAARRTRLPRRPRRHLHDGVERRDLAEGDDPRPRHRDRDLPGDRHRGHPRDHDREVEEGGQEAGRDPRRLERVCPRSTSSPGCTASS